MEKIDKTLNIFYDTLKWIQNAAVDLKFQTEEVEERIHRGREVQRYVWCQRIKDVDIKY